MASASICSIEGCCEVVRHSGLCGSHHWRVKKFGDPAAGRVAKGVPLQWMRDHLSFDEEKCLIWPFAKLKSGRGTVNWGGKTVISARLMCEMVNGAPPSNRHQAAHSCGKGLEGCVHPKHLRWATPIDNMADQIRHGTRMSGTKNPAAVLTVEDVLAIRRSRRSSGAELAERYGVSGATISSIRLGRTWTSVT